MHLDSSLYASSFVYSLNDRGRVCGNVGVLPSGRPAHAAYWPTYRSDAIDLHPKVLEAMPTAIGSMATEVLRNGQIAGCAWETFTSDITVQKAWIYDPRSDSVSLLDAGGADVATVWGLGDSTKWLAGYLDADLPIDGGFGPTRPALWERRNVHGKTVWSLTVLPRPEGCTGFTLNGYGAKEVLTGMLTMADGTVRGCIVSR
jgi:hypothetical protein